MDFASGLTCSVGKTGVVTWDLEDAFFVWLRVSDTGVSEDALTYEVEFIPILVTLDGEAPRGALASVSTEAVVMN